MKRLKIIAIMLVIALFTGNVLPEYGREASGEFVSVLYLPLYRNGILSDAERGYQ